MEIRSAQLALQVGNVLSRTVSPDTYAKAYELLEQAANLDGTDILCQDEGNIFCAAFQGKEVITEQDIAQAEQNIVGTLLQQSEYEFLRSMNTAIFGTDYSSQQKPAIERIFELYPTLTDEQKQTVDRFAYRLLQHPAGIVRLKAVYFAGQLKLDFVFRYLLTTVKGHDPDYSVRDAVEDAMTNQICYGFKNLSQALNYGFTLPPFAIKVTGLLIERAEIFKSSYEILQRSEDPKIQDLILERLLIKTANCDFDHLFIQSELELVSAHLPVFEEVSEGELIEKEVALTTNDISTNILPQQLTITNSEATNELEIADETYLNAEQRVLESAAQIESAIKEDPFLQNIRILFSSADVYKKQAAIVAIYKDPQAKRAVPALIKCLRQNENGILLPFTLITALGEIGDKRAIPVIVTFLKKEKNVKECAEALLKLEAVEYIDLIKKVKLSLPSGEQRKIREIINQMKLLIK